MSKLTERLISLLPGQLKNLSIKFDAELLDQGLLNRLGNYLSTKSPRKLVELSFAITSTKKLDVQRNIIEQMQYQPAMQLLEILSQQPRDNIQGKIEKACVPRWMVIIVGAEIDFLNGKSPVTVEDAINTVFRLCLNLLEKPLGTNG